MTNGNLIDWFREKFLGQAPTYQPQPARFYAAPRPQPVPTIAAATQADQGPTATLVSTREHTQGKSDDNKSGLVSGR